MLSYRDNWSLVRRAPRGGLYIVQFRLVISNAMILGEKPTEFTPANLIQRCLSLLAALPPKDFLLVDDIQD
jgi:hypothetical protein